MWRIILILVIVATVLNAAFDQASVAMVWLTGNPGWYTSSYKTDRFQNGMTFTATPYASVGGTKIAFRIENASDIDMNMRGFIQCHEVGDISRSTWSGPIPDDWLVPANSTTTFSIQTRELSSEAARWRENPWGCEFIL